MKEGRKYPRAADACSCDCGHSCGAGRSLQQCAKAVVAVAVAVPAAVARAKREPMLEATHVGVRVSVRGPMLV